MWATAVEAAGITFELGRHNSACYHMPHEAATVLDALVRYAAYLKVRR